VGDKSTRAHKEITENRVGLSEYIDPNRTVLVIRRCGGVGDILATRPIFTAIKARNNIAIVHYALPRGLAPLVSDMPEINAIIPIEGMDHTLISQYRWHGDISRACIEHEINYRRHVHRMRTDLWADKLGITIHDHSTLFRFTTEERATARRLVEESCNDPDRMFVVSPMSADPRRNLTDDQVITAIRWARAEGYSPVVVTAEPIERKYGRTSYLHGLGLRTWMALMTWTRLCLTTDTGALHLAGLMRVRTAAVFGYTSGRVVAMHYPTVTAIQAHRDHEDGMPCVPCYDWGSCPLMAKCKSKELPCMTAPTGQHVVDALASLASMGETPLSFDVFQNDGSAKISTIRSSTNKNIDMNKIVDETKSLTLEISCSDSGDIGAMVCAAIAAAARTSIGNISCHARNVSPRQAEILGIFPSVHVNRGRDKLPGAKKIEVSEVLVHEDGWQDGVRSMLGIETDGSFGTVRCSAITKDAVMVTHGMQSFDFWAMRDDVIDDDGIVSDHAEWDWEKRLSIMRLARSVVTDNTAIAFAASSLGVPVKFHGKNRVFNGCKSVTMMDRCLVVRRHGGFGDLAMISRGLKKLIDAGQDVGFVVDARWHPLFAAWPDIKLFDSDPGDTGWTCRISLCDPCPASVTEWKDVKAHRKTSHATHVGKDRVRIFANALGVFLKPTEAIPCIMVSESNRNEARAVILPSGPHVYVQCTSAEEYRNWPHMETIAAKLAGEGFSVYVHGASKLIPGTIPVKLGILSSCALISMCDIVISPDSFAVHASAAMEVPCVAIMGPVGAVTRIGNYPMACAVMMNLPCVPCWRNQLDVCYKSGLQESQCMRHLWPEAVYSIVKSRIAECISGMRIPQKKVFSVSESGGIMT
jgi:ADP-heptose:LPS heptosyltransferase